MCLVVPDSELRGFSARLSVLVGVVLFLNQVDGVLKRRKRAQQEEPRPGLR